MKRVRGHALVMFVLAAGSAASACEHGDGAEEPDAMASSSGLALDTGATEETTTEEGSSGEAADERARFLGVFHNENRLVPLGIEVDDPGNVTLAHLEVLPDGTATMTVETCDESAETPPIALRWTMGPGPWLEFSPGPGEQSLRFMTATELRSLVAIPVEGCSLQFEVNGRPVTHETFHPGRACWVSRCGESGTVHIDRCDEAPGPCVYE